MLAFATGTQHPKYLLVDCGVHMSQKYGRNYMRLVLDDLRRATGGRLDYVVATHEHDDHLSGFANFAEDFESQKLSLNEVWLAWTEDDGDPAARRLKRSRRRALAALDATARKLADSAATLGSEGLGFRALASRLDNIRQYFGEAPIPESRRASTADPAAGRGQAPSRTQRALELLKRKAAATRFLGPECAPIKFTGTNVRAYVLGPPRDESMLKKSDPSSGPGKETYLTSAAGLDSFALAVAPDALAAGVGADTDASSFDIDSNRYNELNRHELCFPFGSAVGLDLATTDMERLAADGDHPYAAVAERYQAEASRRIDDDWLYAADALALNLDKHTNNTSLVLAFEIGTPGQGAVLLFAADAQVGSWASWSTKSWQIGRRNITSADLLRRTVVYKVGHHASHNATLRQVDGREFGLPLMSDGVVGLIPVDQHTAEKLPGWDMPAPELYSALRTKSRGNLLRSDDIDEHLTVPRRRWSDVPGAERLRWRASRHEKSSGSPLYYEISVPVPTAGSRRLKKDVEDGK
ncbi:MAG: MBL fold metallo-hydrolase [Planctomycetales bacterium]|nr:MBL fold metallo-hydrolase [Planctomycetales bacterium]